MTRALKKQTVQLEIPAHDLRILGEKLQQSIQLTRARIPFIKYPRARLKAIRALDRAEYMFNTLSTTAQTIDRMKTFLENGFGLNINKLFALAGRGEYASRVTTYSAMTLVNTGIERTLDELAAINAALDKENENVKQTNI